MDSDKKIGSPVDPNGLEEYSVVFTDRSVNHMSNLFCTAMRDIAGALKETYSASAIAIVPGGGTYGMEAIARLYANDARCLVLQHGWFSYRWSQILNTGSITEDLITITAVNEIQDEIEQYRPDYLDVLIKRISEAQPAIVFAPHVETSSGVLLPDDYLKEITQVVHSYGGLFVLDCIASGALWVDMSALGVDVLITAPQKSWSSTPCAAAILFSENAATVAGTLTSSSFACDLNKWLSITREYEAGGYAYHATLPTDSLMTFRDAIHETQACGMDALRDAQWSLGGKVRDLLKAHGYRSVAASGFQSPSVVVSYTDHPDIKNGLLFAEAGMQVAGGVPLMCGEPADFSTFRIGLFGLSKLTNIDDTVGELETVIGDVTSRSRK